MRDDPPVCGCRLSVHDTKFVVLTGGPGAGKTAVLETVAREFCQHVSVLPEAASILFRGGFPRRDSPLARAAAQRAIYHVQHEIELLALEEPCYALVLCDRGTLDGLAYWPYEPERYFSELGTTYAHELARYSEVIHLRSPGLAHGYNHRNAVRIESAEEARTIDHKIAEVWSPHPNVHTIESQADFLHKLSAALRLIRGRLPDCCGAQVR